MISMGWSTKKRYLSIAAALAAGCLLMQGAFAAPPSIRQQPRPQPQTAAVAQHLDLRAPSHLPETAQSSAQERSFGAFPSGRQSLSSQESMQLPALGSNGVRARPTIQEFVHRVHQEGLPVARLFEGKSALVHLGLNPKGKPGLWLVQKTR
jgi:hypothetical protein